ncbi:putative FBD-associated F-box protein At1g55030 [Tripterygium wilfordii]|uniref:putative FBD-associated F-box protein At1g55030 n=1 Tax=Tripterygium wilfordii TaxID=458696 RepID=UPI0018F7F061|nr:putative FBD-associated F-box protein At1g55030 [Tripterygium wilfordii]
MRVTHVLNCLIAFLLVHQPSVRKLSLLVPDTLRVPPTICFSSLKILHLDYITFQDDLSAQRLFSGCPVLEEIELFEIKWHNVTIVSICTPKLQSLKIKDLEIDDHDWDESDGCRVMIFGTSLKYFEYSGEPSNDYCLCELSSMEKVEVKIDNVGPRLKIAAYRLYKLLMGISKLFSS